MNDIEILKEHCVETHNTHKICFTYNDEERIWSLIQRNKDLEQIEKEHKEENGRLMEEIYKKDRIINLMAEMLVKDHEWFYSEFDNYTKQDFIEYFTNKVEEDK